MQLRIRVLAATVVLFTSFAVEVLGRQLLEVEGVELHGEARLAMSGGGTCNVLESDTSYEAKKENDGAPMDIWRLDFLVHNRSGRWLDHLIARFQIESAWPDCTNWDGPEAGRFSQPIEWAGSIGHVQESGRNVVAPGQTLTHTKFLIVLRGSPEPRFANWSMDFDFSVAPPSAADGPAAVPPMSAEQDTVFWQSIMNSTDPADFEAYLRQFPQGVFRTLAQNRLAAFGAPGGGLPASNRLPADADRQADLDSRRAGQLFRPVPQPACKGQSEGAECWKELASHPGCHVWDDYYYADQTVAWTGGCADGLAEGSGTLKWVRGDEESESMGVLLNGKREGHWMERFATGTLSEGPYVEGKRHGHWVARFPDGGSSEGPYVDGNMTGHWVRRWPDGDVGEGSMVDGKQHGHWVYRYPDGEVHEGPYVDGKKHGQWVVRSQDGTTRIETFVRGEEQ